MFLVNTRIQMARAFRMHREIHSNAELIETCTEIVNRNPRNLERLRIARKPVGYLLDKPGHSFWHKVFVIKKPRYIVAEVHHFENGPVITACSAEWALKRQLYRCTDSAAYINVGRVLAQRCLESGICEMDVDKSPSGDKFDLLIKEMQNCGIILYELPRYKYPYSFTKDRPEKPWEIIE
ncbi:39S ribosomal protein L18, mitochondrial isoform X3 [Odontomachus brunneus]|uniref:39S ribosomal protein L18, mitochondrial isoform X1 n=1 Tax=Odontomachus brunneus TaxID=486640 RepID=UPI0013F1FF29|nr:39S ribosomal protein L18, mitochondrial isoform X1 [Odontomachus brunneus]XP_032668349.1 39S ribosomal protein L18, mitochondrial isoform X2 [Odontomachus brunneus]XP_032668350.1 39S ribosomal protein L18, mitochondrial isoform X3 [Odontomachus brunneus]